MKKPGYYSSGEFAKMAHITKKTIRYYDEHNILKPSYVTPYGARFYTDADLARLQQILLLKYLGFSLEDIRQMTINDTDYHFLSDSLKLQLKLVEDRIEQMQVVAQVIRNTSTRIEENKSIDWSQMLDLIHLMGLEKSLKNQYQNASNISARINLHHLYSTNPLGWFPWIFNQCKFTENMKILEVGCGDGTLWIKNLNRLPKDISITLSDLSEGMLRDARRCIGTMDARFQFEAFDCQNIPRQDNQFDLILANHVLFYCIDIPKVCKEISRILKSDGVFICSTYGYYHMKEINQLVAEFDDRIILSGEKLYERFGEDNGKECLSAFFNDIQWIPYEDSLFVTEAEPLISYILSCHGNQNQYLLDHYKEFRNFVTKKVKNGFSITKDAGIFLCQHKH